VSRSRFAAALPLAALVAALPACKGSNDAPPPPARAWSKVSVGYGGTVCAIDNRTALFCWGSAPWTGALGVGDLEPRPDPTAVASVATGWTSVGAGDQFACGIRSGALYCWGSNLDREIDDSSEARRPAPTQIGAATSWVDVAVGSNHACARNASGVLLCWGVNYNGQLGNGTADAGKPASDPVAVTVGTGTKWVEVVAGIGHTCGRRDDGSLWCWGYGSLGAVGQDAWADSPNPFSHGTGWSRVFAGDDTTCGLKGDELWCWGEDTASPALVGTGYAGASAGNSFRCAWTSGGAMSCRGWNDRGQLGVGTNASQTGYVPVPDLHVVAASSGSATTCAIVAGGALKCWGENDDGKIGNGVMGRKWTPTLVAPGGWSFVRAGGDHTCAEQSGGGSPLFCWGANGQGQLGNGTIVSEQAPVEVVTPGGFTAPWYDVTLGIWHTCGIAGPSEANSVYCWGHGGYGELGHDTSFEPVLVDTVWTDVSAGGFHTCARHGDGTVDCFGNNFNGQLGDGTTASRMDPAPAATTVAFAAVSGGYEHSCGISSGKLACWGWNNGGQLGTGDQANRARPTWAQSSATDWASVSAGVYHSCGVRQQGIGSAAVYCWGLNAWGQVGLGSSVYANPTPTAIGLTATGTASVSAGSMSTCAILEGRLSCWGSNYEGALGVGLTSAPQAWEPQQVGTSATWHAVSIGTSHACGINDDGLFCWGSNAYGQLGDGTAWHASPQTVPLP
jgi:alpha-tubulin suppressor-like RCC1 family protein